MEKFKMSDLGNVSLVLQVTRDRAKGSLTISQESYSTQNIFSSGSEWATSSP